MDLLVVDRARRDPALVLLAQVGRATRVTPISVRQRIARMLTVH